MDVAGSLGIPIYTNVQYPFPIDGYPHIPLADEQGDSPPGSSTCQRRGSANGSCSALAPPSRLSRSWSTARWLGRAPTRALPAEFDLTECVQPGTSFALELRVQRWSASTWVEDQDMWWMAGLHRPVWIYPIPLGGLLDVRYDTVSLHAAEAIVSVEVDTDGAADSRVSLARADGFVVARSTVAGSQSGEGHHQLHVAAPDAWTAETPSLYTLVVEVLRTTVWSSTRPHFRSAFARCEWPMGSCSSTTPQ
ncbi:MAG: hypothetical protein R2706_12025 [Acidimicrobiales bacterium]